MLKLLLLILFLIHNTCCSEFLFRFHKAHDCTVTFILFRTIHLHGNFIVRLCNQ